MIQNLRQKFKTNLSQKFKNFAFVRVKTRPFYLEKVKIFEPRRRYFKKLFWCFIKSVLRVVKHRLLRENLKIIKFLAFP